MARLHARRSSNTKNKKEQKEAFDLKVMIHSADGIDVDNMGTKGNPRKYLVFGSLGPNEEFKTSIVQGDPDPTWKCQTGDIDLGNDFSNIELEVDVMRFGSKSDPGTSTGMVSVGKAKIALPVSYNKTITQRAGLERVFGKELVPAGFITVLMRIERYRYTDGYWSKF